MKFLFPFFLFYLEIAELDMKSLLEFPCFWILGRNFFFKFKKMSWEKGLNVVSFAGPVEEFVQHGGLQGLQQPPP